MNILKKFLYAVVIFSTVVFLFTNIYAITLTNSTPSDTLMVNPYNDSFTDMNKTFDSLSVGIIVASILIVVGVIFFYLIPKE